MKVKTLFLISLIGLVLISGCSKNDEFVKIDEVVKEINKNTANIEVPFEELTKEIEADREMLFVDFGKEITSEEVLQKLNNDSILKIDLRVIEELGKNLGVRVYILPIDNILKDTNISSYENEDEKNKIKSIYYTQLYENVTANLSENDFKVRHIFPYNPDFSGYISKSGLEKLKRDKRIIKISLVETSYASLN
ncbi:MAG: hypothetical protein Q8O89_00465 [Nanoarchaeota archaeon]|nr:hypothetical protein [Nanoarchaeota archaeon]